MNNNTYTRRTELPTGGYVNSTYSSENHILMFEEFFWNNNTSQSDEYVNKNGTIYEIQKIFNSRRNLIEFSEFIGDTRVGLHKKYYDNGNLEFVKSYNTQGQLYGISTFYHPDGTIVNSTNYYPPM
jgi:antitoxin component YwqK of YwqJK toxin-antitoxin module